MTISDQVRAACAEVAARARFVSLEQGTLEAYARTLPAVPPPQGADPATEIVEGRP